MNQHYGALRVVRVRPPADASAHVQRKYPAGWLPEERLVHLLTNRVTTIGRALSNEVILMDLTVSREHARLIVDEDGWHIENLTTQNTVRVNGRTVPGGGSMPIHPQDYLVLGSTMLQLIAPQPFSLEGNGQDSVVAESVTLISGSISLEQSSWEGMEDATQENPIPEQKRLLKGWKNPPFSLRAVPAKPPASTPAPDVPEQPEPEQKAHEWEENEENLLGAGITMQFALPQRMGGRMRWLIFGIGITVLVICAVVTLAINSLIGLSTFAQNGPTTLVTALIVPAIPALGISLLVNFMDRFEREPWFLRLAAFLWGAIIAIPPALLIEKNIDAALPTLLGPGTDPLVRPFFQALSTGVTEETIKGLGLLLFFLVLRDEFDNVTDGIVYGALIGAGFAMVENFVYFSQYPKYLPFLIVGRIVLGWLSHSTFTACFGAALGYVRHTHVRWRQILVPFGGYLISVGLHTAFNFVNDLITAVVASSAQDPNIALIAPLAVIGNYIPSFIAQIMLLYFLIKSLSHEAAVIREFLASEVSNGIVRVDEYALLQNSFQRTKRERKVLWEMGFKQWLRVKSLYQTEIGLAFRKWHVSMGDKPKLGYLQPEDAYRQRIKRLRQEVLAAEALRPLKKIA